MKRLARLFRLDEQGWRRHANPWSGWTRVAVSPLLALAVWSRDWIGVWAWGLVGLIILWTLVNPRAFPEPPHFKNWFSRGVLGEKIWIEGKAPAAVARQQPLLTILQAVAGLGLPPLIWGLWWLELWPVLTGLVLIMGGKLWFIDKMVQLYDQTTGAA